MGGRELLVNFIIENREDILSKWINLTIVKDRLNQNKIDPKFFIRHFGERVINGFIEIFKNEKREGDCPAISVMFLFFKNKKIPFKDIFQICVNLKNTFFQIFLNNPSILPVDTIHQLIHILDKNFEGVINDYLYFISKDDSKTNTNEINLNKKEEINYF